jgi:hypothetical protein
VCPLFFLAPCHSGFPVVCPTRLQPAGHGCHADEKSLRDKIVADIPVYSSLLQDHREHDRNRLSRLSHARRFYFPYQQNTVLSFVSQHDSAVTRKWLWTTVFTNHLTLWTLASEQCLHRLVQKKPILPNLAVASKTSSLCSPASSTALRS